MNGLYAGIFTSYLLKTESHARFCSDCLNLSLNKNRVFRDFPKGPVVKTASTAGAAGLIPGWGTKILHSVWCSKKKKKLKKKSFKSWLPI